MIHLLTRYSSHHLLCIIPFHGFHQSPRRPSTADSPRLTNPSLTTKSPHSSARPPFTSSDADTGRDHTQRPGQSHSRPPSPFKSSDRSSHSPDRSHTRARLVLSFFAVVLNYAQNRLHGGTQSTCLKVRIPVSCRFLCLLFLLPARGCPSLLIALTAMHTARDPKHKPTQAGQASPSHVQTEGEPRAIIRSS